MIKDNRYFTALIISCFRQMVLEQYANENEANIACRSQLKSKFDAATSHLTAIGEKLPVGVSLRALHEFLDIHFPIQQKPWPEIPPKNTFWQHKDGVKVEVLGLLDLINTPNQPTRVHYQTKAFAQQTHLLSEWHRDFVLLDSVSF